MTNPLTDDDLAAIAWAPAEVTSADLARDLGKGYSTVALARRRIPDAGGWYCRLHVAPCAVCGRPVASNPSVRRVAHPTCERARQARRSAARRASGAAHVSTPYVARWRRDHPTDAAALRVHERVRRRERRAGNLGEADRAALADLAAAVRAWQEETRREVALRFGRSYRAVLTRRN